MESTFIVETTTPAPRPSHHRPTILFVLLALAISSLLGRSFYLQVVRGKHFIAVAEGNRITAIPITAPRGIIFDRNHVQLVENVASTDIVLDPTLLTTVENDGVLLEKLPAILNIPASKISETLTSVRSSNRPARLVSALSHETVLALEQQQQQLPGIRLASSLVRKYASGQASSPVIGYTSPVSSDDLKTNSNLRPTDITGKAGIEKKFNQELHGRHGVSYAEVNASGLIQEQLNKEDPEAGADIQLGIDIEFQQYILELFDEAAKSDTHRETPLIGAVVALDPQSGEVVALVSYPSYDSNIFSRPELSDQTENIIKDQRQPLFNRAIHGSYPPGSTIKPLLAAAALQDRIITPSTSINSTGGISVGPWQFPDWKAGGHGITNVRKALAESVNTFFYTIVGGYENQTGLGIDRAVKHLQSFGWGDQTGIDLPGETKGFLPTPEWKISKKKEPWYIGDTYHLAIGQGDVLVSPLQVATATASIANGGTLHQPHVVKSLVIKGKEIVPSSRAERLPIDPSHLSTIRDGMRDTVLSGSGRSLSDLPLALAGKTGTAQVGGDNNTHAWFTSFGPYENPSLVITVLLERSGDGDKVAVPFAKNIWQWWGEHRLGIQKTTPETTPSEPREPF